MRAVGVAARARLRATWRRSLVAAAGVVLAAAMAGAAVTVAYGLHTGWDRAARAADLPDVVVRFAAHRRWEIERIVRRLPDLAARGYRLEGLHVGLSAGSHSSTNGVLSVVGSGRRGYAIVAGRDVHGRPGEAVVERGLATAWRLRVGDRIAAGSFRALRIVGIAVSPDNVAFPLAAAPHVYIDRRWVQSKAGAGALPVNVALLWARDPRQVDVLLQQARATTFGIDGLRFVTRSGVRVAVDQAAGVVIALLVGFSLVALGAAGIMLATGASAEVQRRLSVIGIQRAIGMTRLEVAAEHALAAAAIGLVAGAAGLAAGALLASGPSGGLLQALNELSPGWALAGPLAATLVAIVALVVAAAGWPAWRAAGRPTVALLRGGDLAAQSSIRRGAPRLRAAGPGLLGARVALARRTRAVLTIAVLGVSGAVVLLMLALASLVAALQDDPGTIGRRYQLTADLPADRAAEVRRLPGVAAAAPRYVVDAADSYALGEPMRLIAFPGDHARFEAPPLVAGRRLRTAGETEVGQGLSQALGVGVGGALAVQLPSGAERRFRVVGVVGAFEADGRVAYVRPDRLLTAEPGLQPQIAVRVAPGTSVSRVAAALSTGGGAPAPAGAATTRDTSFLGTLTTLLRVVAAIDALVCLSALVQALALTARERRPLLALLRAWGASGRTLALVLAAGATAVTVPAALIAVVLERAALAPLVGRAGAGYADLQLAASDGQALLVAAGLVLLGLLAGAWVAARAAREAPVAGLREE